GVSNVSTDLSPAGFAQDATAVVSSTGSAFGADQEGGTTAFSLDVSAAGVDSGLDTTNGTSIFLFKEGSLVVGRIGGAGGRGGVRRRDQQHEWGRERGAIRLAEAPGRHQSR